MELIVLFSGHIRISQFYAQKRKTPKNPAIHLKKPVLRRKYNLIHKNYN